MTETSEVTTYAYTAYGDLLPDSPTPNAFGYNAEATDYNTGLQYLRARYYNTDTGRFIQKDEYKGDFTQPSTLNRYAYCAGNPVNRIDPSGYIQTPAGATDTVCDVTSQRTLEEYEAALASATTRKEKRILKKIIRFMEGKYSSVDEAAEAAAREMMPISISDPKTGKSYEYSSIIYSQTKTFTDGTTITVYDYTKPHTDKESKSVSTAGTALELFRLDSGVYDEVARVHTHGSYYETQKNSFSEQDIKAADYLNETIYVAYQIESGVVNFDKYDPETGDTTWVTFWMED